MYLFNDQSLYDLLTVVIALLVGGYALVVIVLRLRRSRPELAIGIPIATAFAVRVLAALGVGQLSVAQELRGGDELTFLTRAEDVSAFGIGSPESLDKLAGELHTFLFSLHFRVFDQPVDELMLRVEMITFAVIGIALLSAAVYELAGPRAAVIAAWVLALEPTNVFFSSLLHKEPLMFMAGGLVAYGGAVLWKRGRLSALVPMVLGCLVATATRPYVGWFLVAASAAVLLHAGLTRQRGLRSLALLATVAIVAAAFVPLAWDKSSKGNLEELQISQDANAQNEDANLSLERVDYSTREKLFTNAPTRLYDVVFKPYVWQADNLSQQLGLVGTLVVLGSLVLLLQGALQTGTSIMQRAGPLIYPAALMLYAYAVSAGNAGTAFRYRTHVVAMALALIVALREQRRETREEVTLKLVAKPRTTPILAK